MIAIHRKPTLLVTLAALTVAGLAFAGCSKAKDEKKSAPTPEPTTPAETKPAPKDEPAPAVQKDFVEVQVAHKKPKPTDPVKVRFEGIKVVKAAFDPANLEGGTATFEIDLASLSSGIPKRDKHLSAADYLDVASFATATVEVSEVKKSGSGYAAKATVDLHGVKQDVPVTFSVTGKTAKGVVVNGEAAITRTAFGIGKPVADPDESASDDIKVTMQLTLEPSS